MNLEDRIKILAAAGKAINNDLQANRLDDLFYKVANENPWFIKEYVTKALKNAAENYLSLEKLNDWASQYKIVSKSKIIGLIPAGNIPLVGLHDLICVFISGNISYIKPSSKDSSLLHYIVNTILELEPKAREYIQFVDRLEKFDAVIATGSNNTHRYFEHYFGKYPSVLRRNRTSVGIISKNTSEFELRNLCDDIYEYFGLGCRSVAKLFIEEGFDITKLLDQTKDYEWLGNQNKFYNNYMYNKSVYLVNRVSHFDTGFSLFKEDEGFHSPISVTFFEYFKSIESVNAKLIELDENLQIVVGNNDFDLDLKLVPFGGGQKAGLKDYADNIDVMDFLLQLD